MWLLPVPKRNEKCPDWNGELGPHLGMPLTLYGILGESLESCCPHTQNEVLNLNV